MRKVMAVLAVVGLAAVSPAQAQDGLYKFSKEIAVGGEGGWDYLSIDAPAHRLYVAHATKVVVIDMQAGKVVGDIPDTPGVHQTLKTKQGARTMALDPLTHTIYLATTDYEPRPAGSKERPKAVAGTFRILVYQMTK
ncbi:MAG: hypothetical protein HY047_15555 [Acidobacteria bacterium]|nr:hypothetical protein [Acidobacteriota bacterium]